jgi:sporulation protein YunB
MKKRGSVRTKKQKRVRNAIRIGIALCVVLALLFFLNAKLKPIIQSVTSGIAKQMMVSSINTVVLNALEEKQYGYDDFVNILRDSDGAIQTISLNMVNVNTLKSNISLTIQEELGDAQQKTGVPLGTLLGMDLLRGRGPKIPLQISALGNTTVDVKSTFDTAGINQTRHCIYLEITTGVYSYLTGVSATTDVTTTVPVAETVIVGEVPQTYASLSSDTSISALAGILDNNT